MMESDDLVNFTPMMGADGTDMILEGDGGLHGVSVLYDAYDPDPARWYKFCGMTRMSMGERAETRVGRLRQLQRNFADPHGISSKE